MGIKAKLIAAFSLVALVAAVVGLVGIHGMRFARAAQKQTSAVELPAINSLWMIKDAHDVARRVELVMFMPQLSESEMRGMRANLATARQQAETGIRAFEELPVDGEASALWGRFKIAWERWRRINDEVTSGLSRGGRDRDEAYLVATGESRKAFHEARILLDELTAQEISHAQATQRSFDRKYAATRDLTLGAVVVGVLAALAFGILISGALSGNLSRLVEKARAIADGNLRTVVPEEGCREMRDLAGAFNRMGEKLRAMIGSIQETGAAAGEFSAGFSTLVQEQATSASQQASSVAEVTATVEELSRTSRQIAQNAELVRQRAATSVESAEAGRQRVLQSVEETARIRERVSGIAHKAQLLGEKSHEIGKVMDIIQEVASEIHLLALNATIEAAAAGEHGRRFTVVASEVRRLAERTRESTETIRSLIGEIRNATQESIAAAEQGNHDVDRWRQSIHETAAAFETIIETVENTSETSMQISLSTQQQTSANDQIAETMRQVAELVRSTATQLQRSSASAGELDGMVAQLTDKSAVFRV
jgi:methyl-accepting chemotaxis protein